MPDQDALRSSPTASSSASSSVSSPASPSVNVAEVIDLVKGYVQQETVGPLRGAGRWLAYGSIGAILLASAASMSVLGVLRLLQNEFSSTFDDRWMSLLPYVAGLAVCGVVIGVAVSRISKTTLHQD